MPISENIRNERRSRGITQEELGAALGVTPQAVSRWETGESSPDISTLPRLASLFACTTDSLLDVDRTKLSERKKEYEQRISEATSRGSMSDTLRLCREQAVEFPGDFGALIDLAQNLMFFSYSHMEPRDEMLKEARGLCERVLDGCVDTKLQNDAKKILIDIFVASDERESAKKLAETLPGLYESRELLMPRILGDCEEGYIATVSNISLLFDLTCSLLMSFSYGEPYPPDKKLAILKKVEALRRVMFDGNAAPGEPNPDERWIYEHGLAQRLAEVSAACRDADGTLAYLEIIAAKAAEWDDNGYETGGFTYTDTSLPFELRGECKVAVAKNNEVTMRQETRDIMNRSAFDFICDDPRFAAIREGLTQ